jgi:hypothetical protein
VEQVQPEHFTTTPPRCELCGEVIGVYKPLIIVRGSGERESSRAADPGLTSGASELLYHAACYEPSSGVAARVDP